MHERPGGEPTRGIRWLTRPAVSRHHDQTVQVREGSGRASHPDEPPDGIGVDRWARTGLRRAAHSRRSRLPARPPRDPPPAVPAAGEVLPRGGRPPAVESRGHAVPEPGDPSRAMAVRRSRACAARSASGADRRAPQASSAAVAIAARSSASAVVRAASASREGGSCPAPLPAWRHRPQLSRLRTRRARAVSPARPARRAGRLRLRPLRGRHSRGATSRAASPPAGTLDDHDGMMSETPIASARRRDFIRGAHGLTRVVAGAVAWALPGRPGLGAIGAAARGGGVSGRHACGCRRGQHAGRTRARTDVPRADGRRAREWCSSSTRWGTTRSG